MPKSDRSNEERPKLCTSRPCLYEDIDKHRQDGQTDQTDKSERRIRQKDKDRKD
jgi:hypothetical protein